MPLHKAALGVTTQGRFYVVWKREDPGLTADRGKKSRNRSIRSDWLRAGSLYRKRQTIRPGRWFDVYKRTEKGDDEKYK